MKRSIFAAFVALVPPTSVALAADSSVPSIGAEVDASPIAADGIENLKKTLNEVLRSRRPEEFAFVDRVVALVDQGTLPRSLVESTFNWARKKPRHPFQYFEQALRVRAKEIGVNL